MEYEFHVGDYAETVGGFIGWVSYVDRNYITMKSNEGIISGPWSIPEEQYHFNRIGQYDFTKKDEGKIEPLDYTERFIRNSPVDTTLISCMKKINELVEAVNDLRDKRDEYESD